MASQRIFQNSQMTLVPSTEDEEDNEDEYTFVSEDEGLIILGLDDVTIEAEDRRSFFRREMAALVELHEKSGESDEAWDEWWKNAAAWTPKRLIELMCSIQGENAANECDFLNALSRRVPHELVQHLADDTVHLGKFPGYCQKEVEFMMKHLVDTETNYCVHNFRPTQSAWLQIFKTDQEISDMPLTLSKDRLFQSEKTSLMQKTRAAIDRMVSPQEKNTTKIRMVYTPAFQVFRAGTAERVLMMNALSASGSESEVFATHVGNALLVNAWQHEKWRYYCDILQEIVMIAMLAWGSFYLRRQITPTPLNFFLLSVMSLRATGNLLIQCMTSVVLFCKMEGKAGVKGLFRLLFSLSGLITMFDFVSCIVILVSTSGFVMPVMRGEIGLMYRQNCSDEDLVKIPSLCVPVNMRGAFGAMILFRWFHLGFNLLGTRAVGQNVLPAIYAISRPESTYYVAFLLMMIFGGFHAYYSFAIEENVGDIHDRNQVYLKTISTFMKVYRLNLMGDFDLFELEGVDPEVKGSVIGNITGNTVAAKIVAGEMDDGEFSAMYLGICLFFVTLSIWVNIMMMNVYIGLLSSLYDEAKAEKKHIHFRFLSTLAYNYVVRRLFWEWCYCSKPISLNVGADYGMVWLAFEHRSALEDPTPEKELSEGQDKIMKQLEGMTKQIEELRASIKRERHS